jgi:hypothetical protein
MTHEGKGMKRRALGRARLVTAATALVSAMALAVPGVAGAALYSYRSYSSTPSLTITQNTAMIVDVSGTSSTTSTGTVSWSDVSWSDLSLVN